MITDLTTGNTKKILWAFSIPMLISVIFQQLYNIADSVIAGKCIGENALAAVGASYPITMIFMAVAIGSSAGCAVVVSRLFGGQRYEEMKTAVSTIFITCVVLSIFLTVVGFFAGPALLKLIRTPENVFSDAKLYLNIYIFGFAFLFLYNVATGVFTALGDSRTPLYFLIGSSVGNILLDLLFVAVFHMGVAGVAWATFLAQGISSLLAMLSLFRRLKTIHTKRAYARFSWNSLGQVALIAIPSILQQSFVSVGNLFVQSLVNSFGSAVVAGFASAIKLGTFGVTCLNTLSSALSSFTAQNLGAGKEERIEEGLHVSLKMGVLAALPFLIFYIGFSDTAIGIFMNSESAEAIAAGASYLKIVTPFFLVVMVKCMCDGILRGAGTMVHFMATTFIDLILRVALAFLFTQGFHMGPVGIWLAWPVGWIIGTGLSYLFYRMKPWRKKELIQKKPVPTSVN